MQAENRKNTESVTRTEIPAGLERLLGNLIAINAKANAVGHHAAVGVDEHDAAKIIGISVFWLRKDRRTKRLIPFYRIGDRILYNPSRILEALAAIEEGGSHLKTRGTKVSA